MPIYQILVLKRQAQFRRHFLKAYKNVVNLYDPVTDGDSINFPVVRLKDKSFV